MASKMLMSLSIWKRIACAGTLLAAMGLAPLEVVDLEVGPELAAITTEELAAVVQAHVPVLLVDARGPEVYAQGHLPGAVNVPADQVERLAGMLPQDALIVVYCGGPECPHSLLVGRWLAAHGWPQVLHFVRGYPAWQAAGYPVETESGGLMKAGPQR